MSKMVTRTVIGTKATVKVIDLTTDAITTESVQLSKTFDAGAIDKVKRQAEKTIKAIDPNKTVVAVLSFEKSETLYGVDEAVFMANAVELDPVTRKPIEQEETETEQQGEA